MTTNNEELGIFLGFVPKRQSVTFKVSLEEDPGVGYLVYRTVKVVGDDGKVIVSSDKNKNVAAQVENANNPVGFFLRGIGLYGDRIGQGSLVKKRLAS